MAAGYAKLLHQLVLRIKAATDDYMHNGRMVWHWMNANESKTIFRRTLFVGLLGD